MSYVKLMSVDGWCLLACAASAGGLSVRQNKRQEIRVTRGSGLHGYQHTLTHSNGGFLRFRLLRRQNNFSIDHQGNGDKRIEFVDDGSPGGVC
jgi:hypothetical protein